MHGIPVLSRVNDLQVIKAEVGKGNLHGFGGVRRLAKFHFYSIAPSTVEEKQQADFHTTVGCPEVSFGWSDDL